MARKCKQPVELLPPGHYTMTIDRIRKVRNKPAYRIFAQIVDGPVISEVIHVE